MQILALISIYAPVVIIVLAVGAVVFSLFWVFVPLPHWISNALTGYSFDPGRKTRAATAVSAAKTRGC